MFRHNQLELRNLLAQSLAKEINAQEFEEVVRDLREFGGNRSIDLPPFDHGSVANFRNLLAICKRYNLTELLFNIVEAILTGRHVWTKLEKLFIDYQQTLQNDFSVNDHRLSNAQQLEADDGRKRREQLLDLAKKHPELRGTRFSEVISQAFSVAHAGMTPVSVYPSVFSNKDLSCWDDLINWTSEVAFELDQRYIDALEQVLDQRKRITRGQLSSLVVMLLMPLADDSRYSFRAYFCRDESTHVEEWIRVDARPIKPPIRIDHWVADLQPLLLEALRVAGSMQPSHEEPLLLEIFLPTSLLNEDFAAQLEIPYLTGGLDPLWRHYPVIFRSSNRFQYFHEGALGDSNSSLPGIGNPLPRKWHHAKQQPIDPQRSCLWMHDSVPATAIHTPKRRKDLEDLFGALRVKPDFFAFKRVANLPSCSELRREWITQLIAACPAVSIWWRLGAKSSKGDRRLCFEYPCQQSGSRPLGGCPDLQKSKSQSSDPFTHPFIEQPLRLFHALASLQHYGQFEPGPTGQAFREMVLLVDCVDRWPPPVDVSPALQPQSGQSGPVIVAADEIHRSQ
ncbi:MAG: hypothetical protein ACKO50_06765 [Cyanobium sp.]